MMQLRHPALTLSPMLAAALLLGSAVAVQAQEAPAPQAAPAASAPAAAGAKELGVRVVAVQGIVQARPSADAAWQRVAVGAQFGQGAEFRTGPRSSVKFIIDPDHEVTLDALSVISVLRAIEQNGVVKTDLGMKYGRTDYHVEAGGQEHESTIRVPGNTLAIRGSGVTVAYSPSFGANYYVYESKQVVAYTQGQGTRVLSQGNLNEGDSSAADNAADASYVDPTGTSQTDEEKEVFRDRASLLGDAYADFGFDANRQFAAGTVGRLGPEVTFPSTINGQRVFNLGTTFATATTAMSRLAVRIFDSAFQDGDTVSVHFLDAHGNLRELARNIELTNEGAVFNLALALGRNFLTFTNTSPSGESRSLTGGVEIPNGSGESLLFYLGQSGEAQSLLIIRHPQGDVISNPNSNVRFSAQ